MHEPRELRFPLTKAQYQIWLGANLPGHEGLYPLSVLLRLGGCADPGRMAGAAEELVRQTEVLCLRVADGPDGPVQYLHPHISPCPQRRFASAGQLEDYFCERARAPIPLGGPLAELELLFAPGQAALMLRVHHIASDGAGLCLLAGRYCALYAGEAVEPFPSFLQFAASPACAGAEDEDRDFWRTYLSGAALGTKPRPLEPGPSLQADWAERQLGHALSQRIRACALQAQVSPFAVFLAALSLWVSRACSTPDVTVLVPRLGRDTTEARRTPGMFTLAVPVRLRIDEGASFAELCRQAQAQSRAAAAHKGYGLSAILSDLESAGAAGPLSYFTLSFYNTPVDFHGLPAEARFEFAPAMTNLLTLHVADWAAEGSYLLKLDSRSDWWQPGETARLADSLAFLFSQATAAPDAPCSALTLCAPAEKLRLGALLRGPEPPAFPAVTVHGLFELQAQAHPEAPALFCADRALTYRQLNQAGDAVCQSLLALGAKPGDIVALQLPRTSLAPVAMLGVLKAGCAFLPLDCTWPEERRRFVLRDSGAKLLLCAGPTQVPPGCTAVSIGQLPPLNEISFAPPAVGTADLAYVIYTSGTTGTPKGVLLEHKGLVNLASPQNNPFNQELVRCGRALVAVGNFSFDISLFELFIPLLNGLPVVLADEAAAHDPEALAALIRRHDAGALHCTPSRLLSDLEVPVFREALAGVELILSAGEAFTAPLRDALGKATRARVYNGYGPTETTIGATLGPVDGELTIGRPMAGVHLYILDPQGRLLPAGAQGELAVGGAGVARGYLNRPELTAEKFLDWSDGPLTDRIYRTGDLGWCLPDGRLVFAGRGDGQVKLRGLRIELAEVERRVEQFPGVRQCAVLVKLVEGRQHLCCYYSSGLEYDSDAMREYASAFLTRYMVPDWFFHLEQLPCTPNGKIDRHALLALEVALEVPYTPPATEEERRLCEIFAQVLGKDRVSALESFFDAGGTSLLAARAVLLCKHAGLGVEYADLFQHPTPRALAAWLGGKAPRPAAAPRCTDDEGRCIRAALSANRDYLPGLACPGTVLLTGATGFLGIHILWELLTFTSATVYCLVRPKGSMTPEKRLKGSLFYYFENSFAAEFGKRLFALPGDLCAPEVVQLPAGVRPDTVINCAADVSHFGVGGSIRRTNAGGAAHLADFCLRHGALLVHISTMSVGGFIPRARAAAGVCLSERELWLGQDLSNEYLASKFEAEKQLLLAAGRGLRVKIMRVGNLQGRVSDGEFQINRAANGFTQLLRSIVRTGRCPRALADAAVNFSPVDAVAKAICLLAASKPEYTAFHIFDSNDLPMSALLELLPPLGHPVELVSDEQFDAYLHSAAAAGAGNDDLAGFLTRVSGGALVETPCDSAFSIGALAQEGFAWPVLDQSYLRSCLEGLETLGFFE